MPTQVSPAGPPSKRADLDGVKRKLDGLIGTMADGLRTPGLQGRCKRRSKTDPCAV